MRVKPAIVYATIILILALMVVVFIFNPESSRFYPRCPLSLIGISCPGCGTLRALHCYLHGDFARAFAFNPLLPFGLLFTALLLVRPKLALKVWVPPIVFAVLVLYMIARNIFGF